jgi:hypothetical protein
LTLNTSPGATLAPLRPVTRRSLAQIPLFADDKRKATSN